MVDDNHTRRIAEALERIADAQEKANDIAENLLTSRENDVKNIEGFLDGITELRKKGLL